MGTGAGARSATAEIEEMLAGSDVGRDLAAVDWAQTPLGPPAGWPRALRTMVKVILTSRFSMWMAWGPDLSFFCNDAYRRDTLGDKYPWALGRPAREVWAEIWADIGPRIQTVMETGEATWDEQLLLYVERSGYPEESYHTFSYSPIPDDTGRTAGLLCVVTEDTERVIAARRIGVLRDLGDVGGESGDQRAYLQAAARALDRAGQTLPFTALYLFDGDRSARLAATTGLPSGSPAAPEVIAFEEPDPVWPAADLLTQPSVTVSGVDERFGDLPTGGGAAPPHIAVLQALTERAGGIPFGFLLAGVNRYRPFDGDYRAFIALVAQRLSAGVAAARSLEAERRRAEELAELDRAKTAFFSNVSHEFRTPLTLMLGPLEDAVRRGDGLEPGDVELVRRNGLRMLRLVNALLDFSRIEAGRMRAEYRPVDLARLTRELACTFQDAVDRAGLELAVETENPEAVVYVDADLWERIVLNLVSNAFKVTLAGGIAVRLTPDGAGVRLDVEDTGPGIPPEELDRLFQRFHRVRSMQARSQEGTGIGLALVRELVDLHGGEVTVHSEVGLGSTFTVRLPTGRDHLPSDQVREEAARSQPEIAGLFVEEALAWVADDPRSLSGVEVAADRHGDGVPSAAWARGVAPGGRLLIADDNPDLRRYLGRLLGQVWEVESVPDGVSALARIRERPPDLLITDVMMPGLDGFELLAAVRGDPATRDLPVIVLSARAGEEAAIEGLEAGADDYLPKPFSGRELIARVRSHLELSRVRSEASEQIRSERYLFEQTLQQLPAGVFVVDAPSRRIDLANEAAPRVLGHRIVDLTSVDRYATFRLRRGGTERLPEEERPIVRALAGQLVVDDDLLYERGDGRLITLRVSAAPIRDPDGAIVAVVSVFQDVTERVRNERLLAAQRDILSLIANGEPLARTLAEIAAAVETLTEHGERAQIVVGPDAPPAAEPVLAAGAGAWRTAIRGGDGRILGELIVNRTTELPPSDEDRRTVEFLSRTAVVAIERDRDVRARARQLEELQSSLLPHALPTVPGLEAAAIFHPGDATLDVGGDFYDLFPLPGGLWGMLVGDVCGHGAEAAAVTALTRHTTRAVARLHARPETVLQFVSDALRVSGYNRFCTAVFAVLRLTGSGVVASIANGGHQPPVLRRSGGAVEMLDEHGPLLGVFADSEFPETEVALAPGDTLLFYTDGLVERNDRVEAAGGLGPLIESLTEPDVAGLLVSLERAALGEAPYRPRDDIAVLAATVTQPVPPDR